MICIVFVLIISSIILYYFNYIEFYSQIVNNSLKKDYTKWILSDKYVAKKYAELNGFKIAKTYQLVKYPHQLKFNDKITSFVVKPVDLCDSGGVYLIKNNKYVNSNKNFNKNEIINKLQKLRSEISSEYYMHDKMFNGIIPFSGYIKEELLLDEKGNIPTDYKCYVFNGEIKYIATTFNRRKVNDKQFFDCLWFDRNWIPIKTKMIKRGYKYVENVDKPKNLHKMIKLVENMGKKLQRHCRIDVYLINGNVYFGEYTFFTGASLHTFYCNLVLGLLWIKYKDNNSYNDPIINNLVPKFYNQVHH